MQVATIVALGLSLPVLSSTAEYVWPSKYDWLEDLLSLQAGAIRNGFIDGVSPCSFSSDGTHRQAAAEWVRTAYHDMATHDAATGTGGLDASIFFETEREENVGDAFNSTFGFTNNFYNIRASAADLLALSVIVATGSCGGPKIPFRAGRVDAVEAGPLGVPKPDQDIETHTQIFAKAGFNTSEMITMVACGHTLGGVHGKDFPEITFDNSETNFVHFETEDFFAAFDNKVVTEYLDGTTQNLLVVGKNDTNHSDRRVFGADGNATMHALADPANFQARCADILARMIDTVPASVTLSDPIEPTDIKPYITNLALNSNGTLDFTGRIRVRVTAETGRDYDDMEAHLSYVDRTGTNSSETIKTTRLTFRGGTSSGLYGEVFGWFEFAATLPVDTSISKFHVHLTQPSTGEMSVHDNAGHGFPIDDSILFQPSQSCLNTTVVDGKMALTIVGAVRQERAGQPVHLNLVKEVPRQGVIVPKLEVHDYPMEKTGEKGEYVLFTAKQMLEADSWSTTFDLVLGEGEGESRADFINTGSLTDENCTPL